MHGLFHLMKEKEKLNATQAIEFRRPLKSSSKNEKIITAYRQQISFVTEDRLLHDDIAKSVEFIKM